MVDKELAIIISAREMASAVFDKVNASVNGVGAKIDSVSASVGAASEKMVGAFEHPVDSIKSLGSEIGDKLTSALAGLGPIGEIAAAGLGLIVGAAVAVGGAVWALAEKASAAGNEVKDFHERTGIAVGNIGALEFAVKSAGGSLGTLTGILKKVELQAATDQGGKFAAALKDIGINANEFKKMDSEQQLIALAKGFQTGAKSGNDMAAAVALMGKSGADNIPLLRNMTDDLMESGKKLGVQWSEDTVNSADDLEVGLNTVSTALGDIGTRIGAAVLPAMADMVTQFASSPAFIDGVTGAANMLAHGLGYAVEIIGHLVQGVIDVAAPFIAWQTFLSSLMTSAIKGVIGWVSELIGWFGKFDIVSSVVQSLGGVFTWLKDQVVTAFSTIFSWLQKIPGVGPAIKTAMDAAASSFTSVTAAAHGVGAATDTVGGALLRVGQASTTATSALNTQNKAHNQGVEVTTAHGKATEDTQKKIDELTASLVDATAHHLSTTEVEKLHGTELKDLTLKAKELGLSMPEAMRQWAAAVDKDETAQKVDKINQIIAKSNAQMFDQRAKLDLKATETQVKAAEGALKATEGINTQYAELYMTNAEKAVMAAALQRDKSLAELEPLRTQAPAIYAEAAQRIGVIYDSMVTKAHESVTKQVGWFAASMAQLPDVVGKALQGGGNIAESIGSVFGAQMMNVETGPVGKALIGPISSLGNKIGGEFGANLSKTLANALPGIGALVGPALLKITAMVAGVFSGNTTKAAREDFAKSMGTTLDGLMTKLQGMGAEGQRLANAALNVIGKHDEAGNKAWMGEVSSFLDATKQKEEDLAAASAEAFKTAQTSIGSALGKVITGTIGTQDEFDRLSRIALNTFNTLVKSGVAPIEAMQQIGGSVDVLIASLDKSGLQGSAAYAQLSRWRTLTSVNAPLLDQVGSLNDLMAMTTTLGGMNADVFMDMQVQGESAFAKLTAAGFTSIEAETQMKPLLESIIKAHKDKGYAIDDATQALINQATENGILTDDQLSTNNILMDGLGAMIEAIGGKLPEAWQKAAKAAKDKSAESTTAIEAVGARGVSAIGSIATAMGQLPSSISVDVKGIWHPPKEGGGGGDETSAPAFATEAFVRSPTIAMIGDVAGGELVLKPSTVARVRQDAFTAGASVDRSTGPRGDIASEVAAAVASAMSGFRDEVHQAIKSVVSGDVLVQSVTMLDGAVLDKRTTRTVKRGLASGEILVAQQNVRQRVAG